MKWIKFKDKLPEIGRQINVKFNRHRYGTIHSTGEQLGKYIGMNTVVDMPMVEFDYEDDECYMEVTHWKPSVG